jgi:twitching motility two-component system response regulator PilG
MSSIIREEGPYTVAVLGFNETEHTVLRSMFWLSSRRNPGFEMFDPDVHLSPDLYLVDADDGHFKLHLASIAVTAPKQSAPVVLIGGSAHGTARVVLPRPLRVTRILSVFEQAMNLKRAERNDAHMDQVLVVDDSLPVRKFMELKLAPYSFGVDFADSGERAIGLVAERKYACVFLDVMLPGVDGYQVCKAIKKQRGTATAVVMLTGKTSSFDKIRGTMAGCDAYMTKPVDEEKLLEVIAKFISVRPPAKATPMLSRLSG